MGELAADRVEPRTPIVVRQRLAPPHLLDVRRRMEVVGIEKRPAEPTRERGADRRFPDARDTHHDDDHQPTRWKSMKPRSGFVCTSRTRTRSPTSSPSCPRSTRPSTGGSKMRTHVPLADAPVTMPLNSCPMRREHAGGGGLADQPFDLLGAVLLERALRGQRGEVLVGVRDRPAGERRADEPLRDQVGIASVRGRRVRILAHREAEVADDALARERREVLAAAEQLDDGEREVGEAQGIGRAALQQERVQRGRVGVAREVFAEVGGERDDALPAFGRAHDATENGKPVRLEITRDRAVGCDHEVFDQRPRAVRLLRRQRGDLVAIHLGAELDRLEVERAVRVALGLEPLCDGVLELEVVRQARHRRGRGRQRPAVLEPGPQGPIGELRVVVDEGAIDGRAPQLSSPTANSMTTASRSTSGLSDVRSVLRRSGSIGKMRGGV
jgi:hypothetical protein